MANPFGYGEFIPTGRQAWIDQDLELKQWATDVARYGFDRLVFSEFLTTRTELGVNRGGSIVVPIAPWDRTLSGTTALTEGTSIPVGTPTLDSYQVTVQEYGKAYSYPETMDFFSNLDNQRQLIQTLSFNFSLTWDAKAWAMFDASSHGMRTVAAGSLDSGTAPVALAGTVKLDGTHLDEIYGSLVANYVPKFPDGLYRLVGNWSFFSSIIAEANWTNLQLYNQGGVGIAFQDLGVFKGFRMIATEENTLAGTGFAFGQDVGVQAFASPIEIRREPNFRSDFGRAQAFAWYLIGGIDPSLRDSGTHCFKVKTST